MKNRYIYFLIPVLLLIAAGLQAQSSNQNYVLKRTATDYSGSNYIDEIQYLDGLGRPIETVRKGFNSNIPDLVSLTEYDNSGRVAQSYQPYYKSTYDGAFVTPSTITSGVASQYSYSGYSDSRAFSETKYESSPLDRPQQQFGPGQAWASNGKAVKTRYLVNDNTEKLACRYYQFSNYTITVSGNYAAGSLSVTEVTNEDNAPVYEFKDKLGRVVLQRRYNKEIETGSQYCDTYFIYDDFGNQCYVLPPMASDEMTSGSFNTSSEIVMDFAYIYKYDERNRVSEKKLPGADWVYFVYDKADRLRLTQDGVQRAKASKEWTFMKYDGLGRMVLSGILKNNASRETMKTYVDNYPMTEVKPVSSGDNHWYLYANQSYPTASEAANMKVMVVNYYDDYGFLDKANNWLTQNCRAVSGLSDAEHSSAKGLLTGVRATVLDDAATPSYIYKCFRYDYRGNIVQAGSSTIRSNEFEQEFSRYYLTGEVKEKTIRSLSSTIVTQTETYAYTYDLAGRLERTTHKLGSGTAVVLEQNTYDKLNRLSTQKLANNLETVSFNYNIRGWLTKRIGGKFQQELFYNGHDFAEANQFYNGNIAAIRWRDPGKPGVDRGYVFYYDDLGQMRNSAYGEGSDLMTNLGFYAEHLGLDKNGNITYIVRWGRSDTGESVSMDIPLIQVRKGNQLIAIHDSGTDQSATDLMEFKNHHWGSKLKYAYDANGNMTKDENKLISSIEYNFLNLPRKITMENGSFTRYTYDALGTKLCVERETVGAGGTASFSSKEYAGNKVYNMFGLQMILTSGGYLSKDGGTWKYRYFLQDHLGNNRVVLNESGSPIQVNNYYPFGMTLAENPARTDQNVQHYKFGGKELDRENGIDLYDFEARQYDPSSGRFLTMDPMAEKYYAISPYVYCANNPVMLVDPDGREIKIRYIDGTPTSWIFNGSNQDKAPKHNQFVSDFITAYDYNVSNLAKSGEKNSALKTAAESTSYTLNVVQTEGNSHFETTFNGPSTEGTVFWNPTEGLETSKGILSPATIMEHEFDHGVQWQTKTEQYNKERNHNKNPDSHFTNKEEKRVITGSEYKTGVANGELKAVPKGKENNSSSYRSHGKKGNSFVPVNSPISNRKKP